MKKIISIITLVVVFAGILTFTSCEKEEVAVIKKTGNPIDKVKQTTSYSKTIDGYDVYIDANGNKILIPVNDGKDNDTKHVIECKGQLIEVETSEKEWVYDCRGSGNVCRRINVVDPETGQEEEMIILCGPTH